MKWLLPTDVCVVTGGSNGLGRDLLREFARFGCQTVSLDIKGTLEPVDTNDPVSSDTERPNAINHETDNDIDSTRSSVRDSGAGTDEHVSGDDEEDLEPTLSIECDVRKESDLLRARDLIIEKIGRPPSVVALNAGIRHPLHSIADSTFEDLQSTVDVNLGGVIKCLRTFLPDFIDKKRGFFIIVASALGIVVPKGLSAYGASKAGLIGISEGLAQEIKDYDDVHSLLVCPGQLDSTMFSDVKTPSDVLAPVVSTNKLAAKIVKRVSKAKTSTLYAPAYVRYLPFMNVVPVPVSRFLRRLSGVDTVYDEAVQNDKVSEKDSTEPNSNERRELSTAEDATNASIGLGSS